MKTIPVLGLKSWIWSNNFKSAFLLLCFPLLLAALFFTGAYLFVWWSSGVMQPDGNVAMAPFYTPQVLAAAQQMTFQYLPGILGAAAAWVLIASLFNGMMINAATGARGVTRQEEPELYNLLENLCISRGLPVPRLQVIEDGALNAFASGLTQSGFSITVTRGLMQTLDRQEMEGVLGHELTHIINRDVRLLIVTTVFVGMVSFLSQMAWRTFSRPMFYGGYGYGYGTASSNDDNRQRRSNVPMLLIATLLLAVGYVLALLLRFAISRKREYNADAGSVELTKNPAALASALRKISGQSEVAQVPPDVKQMFIEHKPGLFGSIFALFATHPPIEKRIALLEEMADRKYTPAAPMSGGGNVGGSVPSASAM